MPNPHALTLPPHYTLHSYDTIDSTNLAARRHYELEGAKAFASESTHVFWAHTQTEGRGRNQRTWLSPPGNLYVSLLLSPQKPHHTWAELSFVAALALGEVLQSLLPADIEIAYKWPNDVWVARSKLAGLLLERVEKTPSTASLIIGMGVNISHAPDLSTLAPPSPKGLSYPATCLSHWAPHSSSESILSSWLWSFERMRTQWEQKGFFWVQTQWTARALWLHTPIRVQTITNEYHGVMTGINESGALILSSPDGSHTTITAGDIFGV